MIHGPGSPRHDGVSDYVAHLMHALSEVGVRAISVPVRPGPHGRWLAAAATAAQQARGSRPDLVHVQFAPSAFGFSGLPGILPRLLPPRLPLVTTVHEYGWWAAPSWLPAPAWRPLETARLWDRETGRLVWDSAAVIVTNDGHRDLVRQRTGRHAAEIPLAPNITIRRASPAAQGRVRRRLGLTRDAFLLVFFGFVHPVKGVRYLIEALPTLLTGRPDLHLVVAGGFTSQALPEPEAATFRADLESLADRYGVSGAVTFTGHLEAADVSQILHAADTAVLPFTAGVTLKSGALLATLAHGVPTAVTVPDDPDGHLHDGDNVAVIRRRRDAAAVADTVRRLMDDAGLRHRLSAAGRALTAGRSWPAVAAAHLTVYTKVLTDA